ncbi:glycosyltransferase family 32 protein [Sporormia fimetaria CBS 119925]|uniref:Glycosyltransferase family 32 protein n=1 Tax=Sporormia fimetaria CBS 119925 TaxID=1340428 RepID=A0A6A6UYQ6_9PLEO|nr:glycosyltransferase family 32 protein [Sporormia fimetaria CBS 119925]
MASFKPAFKPAGLLLLAFCITGLLYHFYHFIITPPFPPEPQTSIPKILWWKLGPKGKTPKIDAWTTTCIKLNPSHTARFYDDAKSDAYVASTFASQPDIVSTYLALTIPILKADLLRYLFLLDQGGVWFDLDVSCESPIDTWIPAAFKDKANLVVGWEFDSGWDFGFVRQFATWAILAKPGLSHLALTVDNIVAGLHQAAEKHNTDIAGLKLDMIGDVVDMTGPRRFTNSVYESLEKYQNVTVDVESLAELKEPRLVGDVLILPGYAFAAGSNKYTYEVPKPLVTHHYAGSWKNEHGGEEGG